MLAVASALLIAQATAASPAQPATPPPCASEGHGQFDFFIGEWDVFPAAAPERQVARSRWERLYNGCAVRENWMPLRGAGGGSLNSFDPKTGRWHQTWVGSGGGGHVDFDGGYASGKMVLTGLWPGSGPNGEDGSTRMSYSRLEGGAVRQHGEFSADYGLSWVTTFDFIYRPHQGE